MLSELKVRSTTEYLTHLGRMSDTEILLTDNLRRRQLLVMLEEAQTRLNDCRGFHSQEEFSAAMEEFPPMAPKEEERWREEAYKLELAESEYLKAIGFISVTCVEYHKRHLPASSFLSFFVPGFLSLVQVASAAELADVTDFDTFIESISPDTTSKATNRLITTPEQPLRNIENILKPYFEAFANVNPPFFSKNPYRWITQKGKGNRNTCTAAAYTADQLAKACGIQRVRILDYFELSAAKAKSYSQKELRKEIKDQIDSIINTVKAELSNPAPHN